MFDPKLRTLAVLLAAGMALAAGTTYSIVVGGQVAPDKAIVVNGKTYLPLSVLKELGIPYSLRGSTLTLGARPRPTRPPAGPTSGPRWKAAWARPSSTASGASGPPNSSPS